MLSLKVSIFDQSVHNPYGRAILELTMEKRSLQLLKSEYSEYYLANALILISRHGKHKIRSAIKSKL